MLTMALDRVQVISEGWTSTGNQVACEYAYAGLRPGGEPFMLQLSCTIERGSRGLFPGSKGAVLPFFRLRMIPPPFHEVMGISGAIESQGFGVVVGPFPLRIEMLSDGSMIAGLVTPESALACYRLLMAGDDCALHLITGPQTQLLPLPLPIGPDFAGHAKRILGS